jgi:hypothetical protein
VNLLETAHGTATLGGRRVAFTLVSELPRTGAVKLSFAGELPATFAVRVRLSDWAVPATLRVGTDERTVTAPGWCEVPAREWRAGDAVELAVRCRLTRLSDRYDSQRAALQWGPCVLALPVQAQDDECTRYTTGITPPRLLPGSPLRVQCELMHGLQAVTRELVPFAEAGAAGDAYRVWLASGTPDRAEAANEARSRTGNVVGSIRDGDRDSFVVTFDGKAADADWYSIAFAQPVDVAAVHFAHGHAFHDGGWFDASKGKPIVQARSAASAEWQTIGELADYPATSSTQSKGLADGQVFTLRIAQPVRAAELRVVGTPACGDRAAQAFSSCAELSASR